MTSLTGLSTSNLVMNNQTSFPTSAEQALLSMINNPNTMSFSQNPSTFLINPSSNNYTTQIVINPQQEYMKHILIRVEQSLEMVSQNLVRDLDSLYMMQQQDMNSRKRKHLEVDSDDFIVDGEQTRDGEEGAEGVGCIPQKTSVQQEIDNESIELHQLSDWIQNKKRKKNTSQGKKEILKEFLMLNKSNPYPSERQKEIFMKELDYDKKQLNNWFINARKRYLRKKVAYTPPDIRNKNEFDSILENKVRQSLSTDDEVTPQQ